MSTSGSGLAAGYRLPGHVVQRGYVDEAVIVNLQTGAYHSLNPVGRRMLEAILAREDLARAAADVADAFSQPRERVEADILAFSAALYERGLLEPAV